MNAPSEALYKDFGTLDLGRQSMVLNNLKMMCEINEEILSTPEIAPKLNHKSEIKLLQRALDKFGLRAKDSELDFKISDGDIFEIYNSEGLQIYRNWNFFKFCSYSLAELLTYDWTTLYERPTSVVNALMGLLPQIFGPDATTIQYEIPEYVLTERYLERTKAFKVKMKLASPLLDRQTGAVSSFITTGKVVPMSFDQHDGEKLHFI